MNTQSQSGRGDSTCRFSRGLVALVVLVAAVSFGSGCAEMKQYSVDSWQGPLPMQDLRYVDVDPWTPVPRTDPQRASTEGPIVVPAEVVPAGTPVVPAESPVLPAGAPVIPVEPAVVPPVTPTAPIENPTVPQTDPEPTNRVTP